jgi:hypothetical protein
LDPFCGEVVGQNGSPRYLSVDKEARKFEQSTLVELQSIEQIVELAALLGLLELDVELLKTVECQFPVVVNVDLQGCWANLLIGLAMVAENIITASREESV